MGEDVLGDEILENFNGKGLRYWVERCLSRRVSLSYAGWRGDSLLRNKTGRGVG